MLKLFAVYTIAGVASGLASAQGQSPATQAQTPPQSQTAPPQYSADLKVGEAAPAFSLPGSDGKTHKLSDYKGKTIVLAWFPKAFTGG